MKKTITVLLMLALCLSLCACSAFQKVERQVVGYPAKPCGERGTLWVVAIDTVEGTKEGILRQLLSIHHVGHLSGYHRKDALRIATDHCRLSLVPSTSDGCHDFCLCQITHLVLASTCYTTNSGKYLALS